VREHAQNNQNATTILEQFIAKGEAEVSQDGTVTLSKQRPSKGAGEAVPVIGNLDDFMGMPLEDRS